VGISGIHIESEVGDDKTTREIWYTRQHEAKDNAHNIWGNVDRSDVGAKDRAVRRK
jgi:hypothetical protein